MKKILTFFLTALLAFGVGWADDLTYTFTSKTNGTLTGAPSGVTASFSGTIQQYTSGRGIQITKNNSVSLTIKNFTSSYKLTGITLNYCTNASSGAGTVTAKLGNTAVANSFSITAPSSGGATLRDAVLDVTETVFDGNDLVLTVSVSTNSVYLNYYTVTYSENGGTPTGPTIFHKVTSNDEIVANKKYIVVYESDNMFLGSVPTSANGYGAAVSGPAISGRQVDIDGYDDIAVWTLDNITGSTNLTFSLNDENGYLYAISGSNEYLCLRSDFNSSNYTKWTGIFDENGGCTLRNAGATARFIQYNSSGPNFTCSNTHVNAYLYVEGEAPALPTAVAPTFNPVSGGTFYGSLDVTISSETNGATIYYTTDGSTPTTSSNSIANGGTVTINSSCTIKAIAVAQGYDNSTVAEASYTKETLPMPTFSPGGGTYDIGSTVEVTINAVGGAAIYYTLDGTDPVPSRTAYTGPITISETTTLKAISVLNGETSEVATAEYVFAAAATTCPAEIVFGTESTMTNQMSNAQILAYITDGDEYVSSISGTQVYFYTNGVRVGSRNNTGSITYNLAAQTDNWRVRKVVVNAASFGDEDVSLKVTTSANSTGVTLPIPSSATSFTDYEFTGFDGSNVTSVTVATTYRRVYIKSITIHYECTPQATLTATPNPLNINDTNEAGGKTGTILISGDNLGDDNVGVTEYDHNHSTNFSSNPGFFSHNGTVTDYPVAITYTGQALSATGIVYPANNVVSTSVNINYLYTGPIYVVGNVNDKSWQTVDGVQMTRDENTGQYSVVVNAYNNGNGNAYLYFTKSISGNSYDDLGDNRFSARCNDNQGQPVSSGNWGLTSSTTSVFCDLDTVGYLHTIEMAPGNYKITIDPATNKFMIEPFVVNVTISPEDGTHFTGSSISGTITTNHADATLEWSTDGTNWQPYTDGFTASVASPGQSVTVYARATGNGVTTTAQATYTRDAAPAPAAPSFSIGSSAVPAGTVVTITAPAGCTLYVDGQQVNSPYDVTITHSTSISAYCVNDEGTQSAIVTNTYTIATVCNAEVVFKDNGSDASSATSWAHIGGEGDDNYFDAGRDYISSASDMARIYKGATGLKFGTSSLGGTITFNLNDNTEWKVSHITLNAKAYNDNYYSEVTVTTSDGQTKSTTMTSSTLNGYTLDFDDSSSISSFTISTDARIHLKGFTITYDCAPEVEAPVITPATGTYYENQSVSITADDGCTIYYTTNGSDPTTSSPVYTDPFNVACTPGSTTTIKAIAVDGDGVISDVATEVYTWAAPTVHIHPDSRNTTASSMSVTLTPDPAGAQVYYTTDGSTPSPANGTLYTGPFTVSIPNVGDAVTVKAIAVMGNTSAVATATYTHVESVLDVNVPFFSPLKDHTYYGDQTLQIGCTTPNADIYYEIVEVSGATAPSASDVEDPTHVSTHYDGSTINMTVGNSYYVKAIAYIGNNPSTIAEGWYTILEAPTTQYAYTNLKDFNDKCPTGVTATFLNPVQVVYHSTYTNNGQFAEFCYLRDNTDYACVYFGKRDTSGKTIFNMGDWIDGSQISGLTNIWDRNFHIQLGTNAHTVYTWPTQAIGWSEIIPEEMTCDVIVAGDTISNVWGHYVHLRNTTLSNVADDSDSDPKHKGTITDQSGDATYYDKFYRWSAGECTYNTGGTTYRDVIQHLGDYNQAFFDAKQQDGATFDVYGIVDYFKPDFQLCPIDFLWIYKPVISLQSGTYTSEQTVSITAQTPEWAAEGVVIYYKTDDMEDWAVYTGPITVNSDTRIQAYAEVPAHTATANYNDYVRSVTVDATYDFEGVEDPIITPESQVIEVVDGTESVNITVQTNPASSTGTVTLYTIDGSDPRTSTTAIELTSENGNFDVTETTTVNAVSYLTVDGNTIWSNVVTETYEFIEDNGKTYNLLTTNPKVGSIYVIVNKADKVGLSKTQNATNRAATGVVFTDDATKTVVKGNTALEEFVLEAATAGRYYFRQVGTQNYLVVTTNDNPNLMTGSEGTDAEATVTVNSSVTSGVDESYPATITFSYDGTSRYLRYYAAGRTFTTYTAATTNQDVFLYGIEVPDLLDPAIEPHTQVVQVTGGDELVTVTVTPNSENPAGAVTYYTTDGSDPRTSSTRIEWNSENGEFPVNTTTTVKAVTGMEFGDGMVWSNVVSETYTFVGLEPPTISPESQTAPIGTTITVTVTPSDQNPDGAVTYFTTDGSDPRTNGTIWNSTNGTFPVTENTTVKAVTSLVVEGETVWSVVVSETYTFEATVDSLKNIEATGELEKVYTVADELIGAWAVVNPLTGDKLLWAKDQGNISIDKRPGKIEGKQRDYVKEILKYEKKQTWDESNWVILDFANINSDDGDPEDFVGRKIKAASVEGVYSNNRNYTITLTKAPRYTDENSQEMDAPGYPGWQEPFNPNWLGEAYAGFGFAYNTFVPANFMTENHNRLENGEVVGGFVAPTTALYDLAGDSLYFVNPKIQEVARVWAVWCGNDATTGERKDLFSVYKAEHKENENINAWDLNGTFRVKWDYNCKSKDSGVNGYGVPTGLVEGVAYEFHAAVMRPLTRLNANGDVEPQGELKPGTPTPDYEIYPLDVKDGGTPTAVVEVFGTKTVVGVTYFNLMGQESNKPFDGVNIVVTRYSDGSTSSIKVLR